MCLLCTTVVVGCRQLGNVESNSGCLGQRLAHLVRGRMRTVVVRPSPHLMLLLPANDPDHDRMWQHADVPLLVPLTAPHYVARHVNLPVRR